MAVYIYNQSTDQNSIILDYKVLLIPLLILQTAILGLGIGFIISSLSIKYRDLSRVYGLFTQFIMYGTPVIYPVSEIPERYHYIMMWNPLAFIIESFREILLGHSTACNLNFALPSVLATIILFFFGLILFNKAQRSYVDFV